MLDEEAMKLEKVIEEFEAVTKDAKAVQKETLGKILKANGESEYLQKLGLNGRTDPESFKDCVPLITHEDVEPYILRIADGESSPILTGKPIKTLSLSSGTTQGRSKYVPFTDELMEATVQINRTNFAFRNREYPIDDGKALKFIYCSKQFKTRGGLIAGIATANVFCHPTFKDTLEGLQLQSCSPNEVISGPDFHQSLYCHLLCSLIYREQVQFVSASFAHSIVHAFKTFEQVWEELCTDIRNGFLSNRVTASSVRTAISKVLKPDPELADLIYKKCLGLSNWYGLIPELFPNAKYVHGIMTGSMEPYVKKLRHYAGGVPLSCADYGASEGWIAANVNPKLPPELATFAVLPDIGYFEFIPLDIEDNSKSDDVEPDPVGLTDVKVGAEYEIIITNFAGLYRYRLGDVVKVMGYHNSTPELRFVCRRNIMLSINIDKNSERDLQQAVESATKSLVDHKLEVVDFTSHVCSCTEPGHYIIFLELSGEASDEALEECCNCLDRSFADIGYLSSRRSGTIGALELRVVASGTFQKIVDHYVGLVGSVCQFKMPRCVGVTHKMMLQVLSLNVVKAYFSTAFG